MEEKPYIDLRGLIEPNNNISTFLGLFLNISLLFMVFYKTNDRLIDYRPILLQKIFIDMFYNIMNFVTKMQLDYKEDYFFMMLSGPFEYSSLITVNYLSALWAFALIIDLAGVPVQYIFRYLLIIKDHTVSSLNYLLILMVGFVVSFFYMYGTVIVFWPNQEVMNATRPLLEEDVFYFNGIPNYIVAKIDHELQLLFFYFYIVIAISYITIIFTAIKVNQKLKSQHDQMSALTLDIHKQVHSTLIIQAILPCALCFIPITTAVFMTQMRLNVPGLGMMISIVLSWMPVLNSLVSMIVIRTYRYQLKKIFCCQSVCGTTSSSVQPTKSSQIQDDDSVYTH